MEFLEDVLSLRLEAGDWGLGTSLKPQVSSLKSQAVSCQLATAFWPVKESHKTFPRST